MKYLELSHIGALERLQLFLKLRKGKVITDKTEKDLSKLLNRMDDNFKHHYTIAVYPSDFEIYKAKAKALEAIKSKFVMLDKGGSYRIFDIENFAFYEDRKYRASINGKLIEISEFDFRVITLIFY